MRLFLLPVSTRRSLMYGQRLATAATTTTDRSYIDTGAAWAARKWAQWEKKPSGWQRKVVDYGNRAFRRIPFEEWGLKSVPPLKKARCRNHLEHRVELVFPGTLMAASEAEALALRLATERQGLHRQRMVWCLVGMPITLPFALIPVVPNLPFLYLVYRVWSHWRAISGGRHVEWLVQNKLLLPSPSTTLDRLYGRDATTPPVTETSGKEEMLLTHDQVRSFSQTLQLPALEMELERAIWQVEKALREGEQQQSAASGSDTARGQRKKTESRAPEKPT